MAVRTAKVDNLSLKASEHDIREFFSFSGEIEHVQMQSENDKHKIAYVTFKNPDGAETSVLLSGATIVDQAVTVTLAPDYKLQDDSHTTPTAGTTNQDAAIPDSPIRRAEDVVLNMLAKGFILGKDALNKAKSFDEKHHVTEAATAKVVSLDQKMGLSEKISAGTTMVNEKMKEMDEKYQVLEKTKGAIAAAEQTASSAGSAIMKNRYVLTGASWVIGAYSRVSKAAGEAGQNTPKTPKKDSSEDKGSKMSSDT